MINYEQFVKDNEAEILRSALDAIDPDRMGMTRQNALTLAGAMKNCGFSQEDFSRIMDRSSQNKGTFAEQWDRFTGKGGDGHEDPAQGTIYSYAKKSGWNWPSPKGSRYAGSGSFKTSQGSSQNKADSMVIRDKDISVRCFIDSVQYTDKPAAPEIRQREPTAAEQFEHFSIEDFMQSVTSGKTFYPAVFNKVLTGYDEHGKKMHEYQLTEQQIFTVDIDNDKKTAEGRQRIENPVSIEQAKKICTDNGIEPFLIYETFSSKQHRADPDEPYQKFRLCFAFDKPLTVQEIGIKGIQKARRYFISLFGSAADSATKDTSRMFFGTDEADRAYLQKVFLDSRKFMQELYAPEPEAPAAEELPYADFVCMSDIVGKRPEWLITNWIPKNTVAFIFADGGSGKSSVWCSLIADLSAGRQTILEDMPGDWKPKRCMLLSSEDDADYVIQPKLEENKANMDNIIILPLDSKKLSEMKFGSKIFEGSIQRFKPDVIMIDPIQSFIGDVNMSARNECRDSLNHLVQYGKRYQVTTIIMSHTNKKDATGRNKMSDSSDFWDIARSVLSIGQTRNKTIRFIAHEKCNYGRLQNTVLFEIGGTNGIPIKRGTTPKSAAELSAESRDASAPKMDDCKDAILEYLEAHGQSYTKDLDEYMKACGFAETTIRDAKTELNSAKKTETFRGKKDTDGCKYIIRLKKGSS